MRTRSRAAALIAAVLLATGAARADGEWQTVVAQDGVRVRASAGAASFRRKASLQDNLELARARVRELRFLSKLAADLGAMLADLED